MSDLISRQEVLDGIEELKKSPWATDTRGTGFEYLIAESLDTVRDLVVKPIPSVENKGEWIPVTERLPDNNVRVLCSAISTSISGGYTRFVGCCNNGFWFVQTDAETVSYPGQYKVTAWMPLPEAYKGERGE